MTFRRIHGPLRGTTQLSRTARNIVQRGPSCGEDPALPVLLALFKPLEKAACGFFK